jgi:membrane protease YdiL (CAAX protease family)
MAKPTGVVPLAGSEILPLLLFVVGAYAWTWSFNALKILAMRAGLDLPIPFLLLDMVAGLGPFLAAVAVIRAESQGSGVRALLRQLLRWRIGLGWYTVALLGPIALALAAYGLWVATGGSRPPADAVASWPLLPVFFVYILFVGGGIDEELGWRGFALPRLQDRYGALTASVVLGIFWAGWHIPAWFVPDSPQVALAFPVFLVSVIGIGIVFGWLYNSTGGSLPIVILAHTVFDLCTTGPWARALFSLPLGERGLDPFNLITVAILAVAVGLVIWTDPRTLTGRRPALTRS